MYWCREDDHLKMLNLYGCRECSESVWLNEGQIDPNNMHLLTNDWSRKDAFINGICAHIIVG